MSKGNHHTNRPIFMIMALSGVVGWMMNPLYCTAQVRGAASASQSSLISASAGAWTGNGPGGASLLVLAIDPVNSDILYAGTVAGIFKSTDAGASWFASNAGLGRISINSIAIYPGNPNIVYAGGNDTHVFKSTDGGASWRWANNGLTTSLYALAIDPFKQNTLYAGTSGGLFKSADGGANWSAASDPPASFLDPIFYLAMDPRSMNTMYRIGCNEGDGFCDAGPALSKSTDGGRTWTASISHFRNLYPDLSPICVAIDPTDSRVLYVGTGSRGVYKSMDGGASWSASNTGLSNLSVNAIVINPVNTDTLFAGTDGEGVFRSTDGGANWSEFNVGLTDLNVRALAIDSLGAFLHAGTTAGVFDYQLSAGPTLALDRTQYCVGDTWNMNIVNASSDASIRLVGVSNGVAWDWPDWGRTDEVGHYSDSGTFIDGTQGAYQLSVEIDGILSNTASFSVSKCSLWTPANVNLTDNDIRALAVDSQNPEILYAGTAGHGVFRSTNGGAEWVQTGLQNTKVNVLAMDRSHPGTLYAGTDGRGLLKSTDGGMTWSSTGPATPDVSFVTIDPSNTSRLLAGYTDGADFGILFRSVDGAGSWTQISLPRQYVAFIAIDPQDPNNIYIVDNGYLGMEDVGYLCKTRDGGSTWSIKYLHDIGCMWTLVVDPTDSASLYAGCGEYGGLKSSDGGLAWVSFDLSFETMAADPVNPGSLYAIANGLVYRSTDSGNTWDSLTVRLGYSVQALATSGANPEVVFAGTSGGGVYRSTFGLILALDQGQYCVGDTWNLNIVNGPADASIRLVGVSNGVAWDWPDWGRTDEVGHYSDSGTFIDGTQGAYQLSVEISGNLSNTVSFLVSSCK